MKRYTWCIPLMILILTGCAAAPKPAPTPVSAPEPTATMSPTTSPAPITVPAALTCETLLTPDAMADLAKDHYTLVPNFATEPTDNLHPFIVYGGVACMWAPDYATDNVAVFAKSPITPEQAAKEKATLAAAGWLVTKDTTGEVWSIPEGEDLYPTAVRFKDNTWEYALSAAELTHIAN